MKNNTVKRGLPPILTALLLPIVALILTSCALFGGTNGTGTGNNNSGKTEKQFSVTLHSAEGFSVYDFIDKNTNVIKKPGKEPSKEGYDFVRWCLDEDCTTELPYGTVINSDLDIYPDWTIKVLDVTLVNTIDENGGSVLHVNYDEKVTLPVKQAAGYTFLGWFTDREGNNAYDATAKVKTDLTLYTGWSMDRYAIRYETDGGVLSEGAATSYDMFSATALPTCSKTGYSFVGWFDSASADKTTATPYTEIAKGQQGEKTFYAKYNCDLAGVSAKFDSVKVVEDEISFSAKYTQSTISLTNYLDFSDGASFIVQKDGTETEINLALNDGEQNVVYTYTLLVTSESRSVTNTFNVTITQYTHHNVSVKYYGNGVLLYTDEEHQRGDKAVKIADPTPSDGYVFVRWVEGSVDGEEYDFNSILVDDLNLYAQYDTEVYAIEYKVGYGKNVAANPATYTVEDAVNFAAAVPTNGDEYVFEGWYDDTDYANAVTGIALGSTGRKIVYARYSLKNKSLTDYSERTTIALGEIKSYLTYLFYYRIAEISVTITGGEEGADIAPYIMAANDTIKNVDGAEARSIGYTIYTDPSTNEKYTLKADAEGKWELTGDNKMTVSYQEKPSLSSSEPEYPQVSPYGLSMSVTGRADDYNDFAIDHVADGLYVDDSEQLVFAVEHGYRPEPKAGSVAEEVYAAAKTVLRRIIDDGMTEYDKALAIYEYIIKNISYDHAVFDRVVSGEIATAEANRYCCFYLEGVFNDKIAVCDGYSKAFMLLCRIEGIRAVQVEGSAVSGGTGHAWNKVYLSENGGERKWYVVDSTSGDTLARLGESASKEVMTHAFFLITDTMMSTLYRAENDEFSTFVATGKGSYYDNVTFHWDDADRSRSISSDEDMAAFLSYLITYTPNDIQVSMDIHICLENDEYDPFTRDSSGKVNNIRDDVLQLVGTKINSYALTWITAEEYNVFTFLSAKK